MASTSPSVSLTKTRSTTWDLISQSLLHLNSSPWVALCLAPPATPETAKSAKRSHQEASVPKAPKEWPISVWMETCKTVIFLQLAANRIQIPTALQKARVRKFVTLLDTSQSSCNLACKPLARELATSQTMTPVLLPKAALERIEGQMARTLSTCLRAKWRNSAWMPQMLTPAVKTRMRWPRATLPSALEA